MSRKFTTYCLTAAAFSITLNCRRALWETPLSSRGPIGSCVDVVVIDISLILWTQRPLGAEAKMFVIVFIVLIFTIIIITVMTSSFFFKAAS